MLRKRRSGRKLRKKKGKTGAQKQLFQGRYTVVCINPFATCFLLSSSHDSSPVQTDLLRPLLPQPSLPQTSLTAFVLQATGAPALLSQAPLSAGGRIHQLATLSFRHKGMAKNVPALICNIVGLPHRHSKNGSAHKSLIRLQ